MSKKLIYAVSVLLVLSLVGTDPAYGFVVWEGNIAGGNDSVEDQLDRGMYMGSSDLEFPNDGGLQVIGLRFLNVGVPKGVTVTNAYIEFTVDETSGSEPANLIIDGELSPDAPPFANVDSLHCTLELNHQTVPNFSPGGLQFELWNGEQLITERRAPTQAILSQPDEVGRRTQKMES